MNFGDALQIFIVENRDHILLLIGPVASPNVKPTPKIDEKRQRLTGRLFTHRRKAEEATDPIAPSAALLQKDIAETKNWHLSLGKTDLLCSGLTLLPSIRICLPWGVSDIPAGYGLRPITPRH